MDDITIWLKLPTEWMLCCQIVREILKRELIIFFKSGVLYRRWGVFKKLQCHFQGPRTELNQRQMGAQSCACSFIWTWQS